MKRLILILSAMMMLCTLPAPALAQATKDELKAQFKTREADLRELKQKGQVGETIDGYVEVVDAKASAEAKVATLVSDENKDRRLLYQLLADEINKESPNAKVKATVETIAVRNAARIIERAGKEEFLRVAKDHWIRVKDYSRFEKISKLKAQGKVGETSGGLLEFIQAADSADKANAALVNAENDARNSEYKAIAEKEKSDVAAIVKKMAKRNFDNARVGEMLKQEDGSWKKK
ncbi:MAG: DUF1318 domain-containing protein [Pyrinomonadaceae bacterium]|nr:DUF1318 domain-containing protein [Phycisphaerales bacterium]